MLELLQVIVITSLFCNGLKVATEENMVLSFIREWLNKYLLYEEAGEFKPRKIYYPLLYCVKCMPSIYGTAIALILLPLTPSLIYQIPIAIVCSSALSAVIYSLID